MTEYQKQFVLGYQIFNQLHFYNEEVRILIIYKNLVPNKQYYKLL